MSKSNFPWGTPKPAEASTAPTSNSSRNALKHGCCAINTLILPHENIEDHKALETTWFQAYNPQSDAERHLVQELANADWLLQRVTAAHAKIETDLYTLHESPSGWSEAQERKLGRHMRYKTAQANLVAKARKAIEDFRKDRANEKQAAEKLVILKERAQAQNKKNNRGIGNWKEHLEQMRQKAISLGYTPPEPGSI